MLHARDAWQQSEFCCWLHRHFIWHVTWSDKACFTIDSGSSNRNGDIWALQNSYMTTSRRFHQQFRVNDWGGTLNNYLLPLRVTNSNSIPHGGLTISQKGLVLVAYLLTTSKYFEYLFKITNLLNLILQVAESLAHRCAIVVICW